MPEVERTWAEQLPESCPPSHALDARGERFLRAVKSVPPTDEDFRPNIIKFPVKKGSFQECQSKAVSVFDDLTAVQNTLKIGELQQYKAVVWLKLPVGSGKTLKTGRPSHYSWWRQQGFNPLEHYTLVTE